MHFYYNYYSAYTNLQPPQWVMHITHKPVLDETFNSDAKLNSFLIIFDDGLKNKAPIQPSFFSFGSGYSDVQVKS